MKSIVVLGLSVCVAGVLTGCASVPTVAQHEAPAKMQERMQFACGNGEKVEMQFLPGQERGVLRRSGWTVELPQRATPSGYAYSNGATTVQGHGNELTIRIGHLAPIWCRSAPGALVAGL